MTYLPGLAFIVIGRNEGWKLGLCLASIFKAIRINSIKQYDVIYVDSDSQDDSLEIALSFPEVSVYKLNGVYNAAIARNTGAEATNLSSLFFVDGDMEIEPDFLGSVIDSEGFLIYEYVSGQLKNLNYNRDWERTGESWQYSALISSDRKMSTCGGIFLIEHSIWDTTGAMDTRFKRGQDLDFSLRLSARGKLLCRKKELIACHHTISYTHVDRIWRTIVSGDILYSKSLLYRVHWNNRAMYKKMLQTDYSMLLLFACLLFMCATRSMYWGLPYISIVLLRVLKKNHQSIKDIVNNLAFVPVRDSLTLVGFIVFFPKRPSSFDYNIELIRHVRN